MYTYKRQADCENIVVEFQDLLEAVNFATKDCAKLTSEQHLDFAEVSEKNSGRLIYSARTMR